MSRLANIAGLLFVILSLGFVAERIWASEIWHTDSATLRSLTLVIMGCALIYALSGFLLATGWRGLILRLYQGRFSWHSGIAVYARSQIAKYMPGNLFHIVGRHAYGLKLGLGHQPQVVAAFLEVMLTILAAATLVVLGWSLHTLENADSHHPVLLIALAAIGLLLSAWMAKTWLPRIPYLRMSKEGGKGTIIPWRGFWQAYSLYLIFFLVSAAILWILVTVISGSPWSANPGNAWLTFIPITALAWLLGFITPGASAGIGVREAVLIMLLTSLVGDRDATLAAVGFRLVTVIGDLGFFLCSFLFRERPSMPLQNVQSGNYNGIEQDEQCP